MRKSFLILAFVALFVPCAVGVFAGPPVKMIKVTVINRCEWDVPVGLGRDVRMWWLDDDEKKKLTMKRVPANGRIVFEDIQAGIADFCFVVFNETTNYYQYNDDLKFLRDTVITMTYDHDEMKYKWDIEDAVPRR
jgi:hypothetical protein